MLASQIPFRLAYLNEMIMKVPQATEVEPPTCQNSPLLLENLGSSKCGGEVTQLKRHNRHDRRKQHKQKHQSTTSEAIAKI